MLFLHAPIHRNVDRRTDRSILVPGGLFFIWLGPARLGKHRHRLFFIFAGIGFRRAGAGYGFRLKPGSIPVDVILIIMSVIAPSPPCRWPAGWISWCTWPKRCCAATQVHHLHLAPVVTYTMTMFAGYRADGLFHPAGDCRGGQGERRAPVAAAGHCHGGVPDCHHRIAHIGGGYFFRQ
jgi:hypothetical protein